MDYYSQFPEALYVPKDTYSLQLYEERILTGEALMKRSTVAIAMLARNVERVLPYTIARVEYLASLFKSARIVVVENDSKDDTKLSLREWINKNSSVTLISDDYSVPYLTDKSLRRREIMAFQRNKYLEYIYENLNPDYMIVMDSDCFGGHSWLGIKNSFGWNQEWSCMASNSIIYREHEGKIEKLFYDTFAHVKLGENSWNSVCGDSGNRMIFNVGDEPVPVNSSFGGLAIYRYSDIKELWPKYSSEFCDHTTFNKILREAGKNLYINGSQVCLQSPTSVSFRLSR